MAANMAALQFLLRERDAGFAATDSSVGTRLCLNIFLVLETIYTKVVSKVDKPMNAFLSPIEKPRSFPDHLEQIRIASVQWSAMNWLRSLLGLAGVLFSFKGLDTYYATRSAGR